MCAIDFRSCGADCSIPSSERSALPRPFAPVRLWSSVLDPLPSSPPPLLRSPTHSPPSAAHRIDRHRPPPCQPHCSPPHIPILSSPHQISIISCTCSRPSSAGNGGLPRRLWHSPSHLPADSLSNTASPSTATPLTLAASPLHQARVVPQGGVCTSTSRRHGRENTRRHDDIHDAAPTSRPEIGYKLDGTL